MNYVLKLELQGAEEIRGVLNQLLSLQGTLNAGKGLAPAAQEANRDVQDIARAMQSGQKASSKMVSDLDKIASTLGARGGFSSLNASLQKKILEQHPELAEQLKMAATGASAGGKIENPPPFQGPDMGGILRADWKKRTDNFKKEWKRNMEELSEEYNPSFMKAKNFFKTSKPPVLEQKTQPNWKNLLIGLGLGPSNPYIGARLLSDEFAKGKGQGGIAGGLFGKMGITGFAEIFLAFKAFGFAVDVFKKSVDIVSKVAEQARKLYSASLQSGMGVRATSQFGMIASILGVDEKEIFRFGAQLSYIAPKIKEATDLIAAANPELTTLSINIKIFEINVAALIATIVKDVSPIFRVIVFGLNEMVLGLTHLYEWFKKIAGSLSNSMWFSIFHPLASFFLNVIKMLKVAGSLLGTIPGPSSWMKQIPGSAWEHMGLGIGGMGQTDYQKQIANNTKGILQRMDKLVQVVSHPSQGIFNGAMNNL